MRPSLQTVVRPHLLRQWRRRWTQDLLPLVLVLLPGSSRAQQKQQQQPQGVEGAALRWWRGWPPPLLWLRPLLLQEEWE